MWSNSEESLDSQTPVSFGDTHSCFDRPRLLPWLSVTMERSAVKSDPFGVTEGSHVSSWSGLESCGDGGKAIGENCDDGDTGLALGEN